MKNKLMSTAKAKAVKAKLAKKVGAKKPIKKAQMGTKETMLPEVTKKATSLRPMEIALGDDRKMSIDTVGYKSGNYRSPDKMRNETFNYTVSDKSGKVIKQDRLTSQPGRSRVGIVDDMVKGLESGKLKRPAFKSGGKMMAKKGASVKSSGMHKMPDGSMMKNSKMKSGGTVKAKTGIKKMMGGGKCKMGC
jgi:hypothetical protein